MNGLSMQKDCTASFHRNCSSQKTKETKQADAMSAISAENAKDHGIRRTVNNMSSVTTAMSNVRLTKKGQLPFLRRTLSLNPSSN